MIHGHGDIESMMNFVVEWVHDLHYIDLSVVENV